MSAPIISLREVEFLYRIRNGLFRHFEHQALRAVSFDIYRGETVGLIGRNGSGKSTLLRLIAGIVRPDSGQITMAPDVSVTLLTLHAGFDPELPGRDNVVLSGMLLGLPYRTILAKLDKVVAFAELEAFIGEPLKTYSDGMRARLGFALALELVPDVFLVDEVLGVGDAAFMRKAKNAMRCKLTSEQTVVYVSHDLQSVVELCDRVIWVENGLTRIAGKASEVVEAYLAAILEEENLKCERLQIEAEAKNKWVKARSETQIPFVKSFKQDIDQVNVNVSPENVGLVVIHGHGLERAEDCLFSLASLPAPQDMGILVVACFGSPNEAREVYSWAKTGWPGGAVLVSGDQVGETVLGAPPGGKCRCVVLDLGPQSTEIQARNAAGRYLCGIPGLLWAWFLASEMTVVPGAPFAFLQHMSSRPYSVLGCCVEDHLREEMLKCAGGCTLSQGTMRTCYVGEGVPRDQAVEQGQYALDSVYGGCMAVPLELFRTIGLFDEGYSPAHADLDFCQRAVQVGCTLEYCFSSRVQGHERLPLGTSSPALVQEEMLVSELRSALRYARKYHPDGLFWLRFQRGLRQIPLLVVRGQWKLARKLWHELRRA